MKARLDELRLAKSKNKKQSYWDLNKIKSRLELCKNYDAFKTLQLLANAYKHDSRKGPGEGLIDYLGLDKRSR